MVFGLRLAASMLPGLLALAGATPAAAQMVSKQSVLADYGTCVVRLSPGRARTFLETPLETPQERAAGAIVVRADDGCLHGMPMLSMRVGAIRGAIAEAMLARDPALMAAARALPSAPPSRAKRGANGRAFMINYAACLIDADPADTLKLVGTASGSPEERDTFLGYGDMLKACMPDRVAYHVNITDLRNQLASVLYLKAAGKPVGA